MFVIKNLTGRNVIFQGMNILPYAKVMVSSIHDFTALSKFTNAGKLSYTRVEVKKEITGTNTKPVEKVKNELKKVDSEEEPKKEIAKDVKSVEVDPIIENTNTPETEAEKTEEKEVKETKKKNNSSRKYNKKWDN